MKRSIRRQMMIVFVGLIIFILVLMFAANSGFLEKYYTVHKQADLLSMYKSLDNAIQDGSIQEESVIDKLGRQTEKTNISVVVGKQEKGTLDIVYPTVKEDDSLLVFKLISYILDRNQDTGRVLKSTDTYKIYKTKDFMNKTEYLEMWGQMSDGAYFIIRTPLESIRESAELANKFLVYLGGVAVILGAVLVYYFSKRITDPLKELAVLSQRMANLEFDAKYTSGGDNEIGVLGKNFNVMSGRLEKTISELKSANNQIGRAHV